MNSFINTEEMGSLDWGEDMLRVCVCVRLAGAGGDNW